MKTIKPLMIILLGFLNLIVLGEDTPWNVPQDKDGVTAPTMFTTNMVKAGNDLYQVNCKSCHGDIGANNMIKLNPLPKDLNTVGTQSDGSFYYKIKEGRGAMPTFINTLLATDRWNIIAYIRSFHKNYTQPKSVEASTFAGSSITLALDYLAEAKQFKVTALGKLKEEQVPAEGVEIAIFAARYFGNLKLSDNKLTNSKGVVLFDLPTNLPGDTAGVLHLIAKVADTDKFGDAIVKKQIVAGIPTNKPSLTEVRAMWNIGSKAPWWITLAYPIAVLLVLGTIVYIMLLLRRVYILGKEK